jgi:hypothetical protein
MVIGLNIEKNFVPVTDKDHPELTCIECGETKKASKFPRRIKIIEGVSCYLWRNKCRKCISPTLSKFQQPDYPEKKKKTIPEIGDIITTKPEVQIGCPLFLKDDKVELKEDPKNQKEKTLDLHDDCEDCREEYIICECCGDLKPAKDFDFIDDDNPPIISDLKTKKKDVLLELAKDLKRIAKIPTK